MHRNRDLIGRRPIGEYRKEKRIIIMQRNEPTMRELCEKYCDKKRLFAYRDLEALPQLRGRRLTDGTNNKSNGSRALFTPSR